MVPAVLLGMVAVAAIVLSTAAGLEGWMRVAGIAGAGALGVLGTMLYGRAMQNEYRGLAAIRRALRMAADEQAGGVEQSAMALGVSAHFGPEAEAFSQILKQREDLKRQALSMQTEQRLTNKGGGAGGSGELGSVCDALWVGLLLVDGEFRVLYANGAAGVFLGRRREELQKSGMLGALNDQRLIDLIKGVTSGAVRTRQSVEVRQEASPITDDASGESELRLADGGERRGRAPARKAGGFTHGATILKFTVRPVRREDAGAAMVVIEDVTQQRVADEARNSFVAHATHELRTPLTNIKLYVDELVESGGDDAAARGKCLNVISQESRRLERIVGDMLSVSEIEAGSMKLRTGDIRLPQLFEEIENDYRAAAEAKKQRLVLELPPKMPVLQGDRDKVGLALHNLVGNALKYTPEGGTVTVRAGEDAGQFVFEVMDTGIGIKAEECELVFERFYRAQDKRIAGISGSGLGLALAREIARLHGGDITVKSEIDKGSTFTLRLPMTSAPAQAGAQRRAA